MWDNGRLVICDPEEMWISVGVEIAGEEKRWRASFPRASKPPELLVFTDNVLTRQWRDIN
jgi:hypothetical protein